MQISGTSIFSRGLVPANDLYKTRPIKCMGGGLAKYVHTYSILFLAQGCDNTFLWLIYTRMPTLHEIHMFQLMYGNTVSTRFENFLVMERSRIIFQHTKTAANSVHLSLLLCTDSCHRFIDFYVGDLNLRCAYDYDISSDDKHRFFYNKIRKQ